MAIFLSLPIIMYGQFEDADRRLREVVARGIQHESELIAQALRPVLDRSDGPPYESLNDELAKYIDDGRSLKLMFRSEAGKGGGRFFYVASAPVTRAEELDRERNEFAEHGILQQLATSCAGGGSLALRYRLPTQDEEVLASEVPIKTRWGCWVLISVHTTREFLDTIVDRPYWQSHEIRLAVVCYLSLAVLSVMTVLSAWRSLRHFRDVAHEIGHAGVLDASFAARNRLPELSSVAEDFDRVMLNLHNVAEDIRQTAEDNAHSFKSPLATIHSSLTPVKRVIPMDDFRAQRAISLVDSALGRLRALVDAAQQLDRNTADLIDAPRRKVDLTQLVADILLRSREIMASRGILLTRRLDARVTVRAASEVLETIVENIIDNAISFSPPGGMIEVTLSRRYRAVDLRIEDQGPGIDPEKIDQIFERYFSLRANAIEDDDAVTDDKDLKHSGLGLWIVRRNVEALGGSVRATNRPGGGLGVHVVLPSAE